MKHLELFAKPGWFNTREDVWQLLIHLKQLHPVFPEKHVTREALHSLLYPKKKFRDLWMRQLLSLTQKVTEDFLKAQWVEQNPDVGEIWLMQQYRERGLQKHFKGAERAARKSQNAVNKKGIAHHYQQYLIESETELMREQTQGRSPNTNLQPVANELDLFFVARKLKMAAQMTTYENIFGQPYQQQLVPELLAFLDYSDSHDPLVNLYRNALMTLKDPENQNHFFQLKKLLNTHQEELPKEEANDLHTLARNYAIRQANLGNAGEYLPLLFELYQLGLENEILLSNSGQITSSAFKNIVGLGLVLNELNWVESFLENYGERLPEKERSDSLNYNRAKLEFARGNFRKVIPLLRDTDYANLFVRMDTKVLLIKSWFELNDIDSLTSLLDSFEAMVKRQKHLGYHANNYLTMARFTRSLLTLDQSNQTAKNQLLEKIEAVEVLTEKRWLLSKIK